MSFRVYLSYICLFAFFVALVFSCSPYTKMKRVRDGEVALELSVPGDEDEDKDEEPEAVVDSIRGELTDGTIIMNAIRDSETGEMVATDVIRASKVVARFRNVAERGGYVSIGFDVMVPSGMSDSRWQLKIRPMMEIQNDTVLLDPVFITGSQYRAAQMKGYERYRAFLSSIITDTADLVWIRQLEIFLKRHFPETYAMKNDSSYVADKVAENLFGVTQREAAIHYTRHFKVWLNERRKSRVDKMYSRYVKDPIVTEGVRLDTVLTDCDGDFIYRYTHTFKSRPRLKKVYVSLDGSLYEKGEMLLHLPFPEKLTFYISTLSTLVDPAPRYRMQILERKVFDNTKALIDFSMGSSQVDTALGDNASELKRILRCMEDVLSIQEYELDSLVVAASCSPEGSYALNTRLANARSQAVQEYLREKIPHEWKESLRTDCVPENWEQFRLLVESDTLISYSDKKMIMELTSDIRDHDKVERRISGMHCYRYLRERIYPQLRSVRFDFHMHRRGMVKDTVHTTELDSVYMSGVEALKNMDYKKAVAILRPYDDYNAALAFMTADYNHSALDVLGRLDDTDARVCYLKAMVLSRLGQHGEAEKYFLLAVAYDPSMKYRANLDPEMHRIINNITL